MVHHIKPKPKAMNKIKQIIEWFRSLFREMKEEMEVVEDILEQQKNQAKTEPSKLLKAVREDDTLTKIEVEMYNNFSKRALKAREINIGSWNQIAGDAAFISGELNTRIEQNSGLVTSGKIYKVTLLFNVLKEDLINHERSYSDIGLKIARMINYLVECRMIVAFPAPRILFSRNFIVNYDNQRTALKIEVLSPFPEERWIEDLLPNVMLKKYIAHDYVMLKMIDSFVTNVEEAMTLKELEDLLDNKVLLPESVVRKFNQRVAGYNIITEEDGNN